jgi:hypothetical protein
MLERIPSISLKGLNAYFCSIDSMLSSYDGSTMLELAIWKLKIEEQTDGNINLLTPDMKMECRNISIEMVGVIFPIVLPFLRGNANEGDDGDDDDGDDDEDDEDDEYGDTDDDNSVEVDGDDDANEGDDGDDDYGDDDEDDEDDEYGDGDDYDTDDDDSD